MPGRRQSLRLAAICMLAVLASQCSGQARPTRPDLLWRNFNAMLVVCAEDALLDQWRLSNADGTAALIGINTNFARVMQQALRSRYGRFDINIAVAVWNQDHPMSFDGAISSRDVGVVPYNRCQKPPVRTSLQTTHAPCQEGGAAGKGNPYDSRKAFMVFYSPAVYDRDFTLAFAHCAFFEQVIGDAIEVCLRRQWHSGFSLRDFGTCVTVEVGEPFMFTGIRGMAVMPNPLPDEQYAQPYGHTIPTGLVVVTPIKMARSDRSQPLLPDLPADHKELCLVFGVPLVLDEI